MAPNPTMSLIINREPKEVSKAYLESTAGFKTKANQVLNEVGAATDVNGEGKNVMNEM